MIDLVGMELSMFDASTDPSEQVLYTCISMEAYSNNMIEALGVPENRRSTAPLTTALACHCTPEESCSQCWKLEPASPTRRSSMVHESKRQCRLAGKHDQSGSCGIAHSHVTVHGQPNQGCCCRIKARTRVHPKHKGFRIGLDHNCR